MKKKKPLGYYMRLLHRDIGFFIAGLAAIYCISGVILIYRDTDIFKVEEIIKKKVDSNIEESSALGKAIGIKKLKITESVGDTIYYENGFYNKKNGVAIYSEKQLPVFLKKITNLHKSSNEKAVSWFTNVFSVLLFFMIVSSFWMFKPKTNVFKRGIIISCIGFICALLIVFI